MPHHPGPDQHAALKILLWQGYHLLTALALAVPGVASAACTLDADDRSLHALLYGPAAEPSFLTDQRVLLLRYYENDGFWAPGGSLEQGEDYTTAVLRELREELGAEKVDLGAQIAERSKDHPVGGLQVRQVEKYFLARVAPADIAPVRATQTDNIRSQRWWTLENLRATRETVYPLGLSELVTGIPAEGLPEEPIILR
ncbi:NUDIX domain-containing protein [Streptomyces sp. NPDC088124]|uniref:NUDIX domain-containing protein n=1 Tax=Streptomyces sp. NPDC088124 TaxID=3154654 RepID=UPI00343F45DB